MSRFRFWRKDEVDALDPELQSIFLAGAQPPALDPARLERGRALVAARLRPQPATGGWLRQRLAYGAIGGGGLWAAVAGTAAAHKAATAVGIGVLLASGATAEITGIGPAVREAVSPSHAPVEDATTAPAVATAEALSTVEAEATHDGPEQNGNGNGAVVTDAPEGVPGNLTAHLRPDGSFQLRGLLVTAGATSIEVLTSVDDVPLQFDLGDASIQIPGANPAPGGPNANDAEPDLRPFEGQLVTVVGECDTVDGQLTEDCTLTRITVLGSAAAGDRDEAESNSANPGNGLGRGQPADPGQLEDPGRPDDPDRPDDPGKPENAPGNTPPDNPGRPNQG